MLAPLAADPHGSGSSARAKRLMAVLAQTPDGELIDLKQLRANAGGNSAQAED